MGIVFEAEVAIVRDHERVGRAAAHVDDAATVVYVRRLVDGKWVAVSTCAQMPGCLCFVAPAFTAVVDHRRVDDSKQPVVVARTRGSRLARAALRHVGKLGGDEGVNLLCRDGLPALDTASDCAGKG